MSEERIELPQCTLEVLPNRVVRCIQRQEVEQTAETVDLLLETLRGVSDEPIRLLVLMNGQPTGKAARARLTRAKEFDAVAMVLSSTVGTMLVNFFLRVNKPPYPMRVFDDEESAHTWLLGLPV